MKRKFGQPTLPNLYYKDADGILSVPGYTFEKVHQWDDTGSMTRLAEGSSLKDSSNVLAKIAPAQSNGSMCLEREAHILGRISASSDNPSLRLIDFLTIPKENGNVVVLLLFHPGPNLLGRYLPPSKINPLLLADMSHVRPSSTHKDIYMLGMEEPDLEEMEAFDVMDLASFLEFAIQATHCLEASHRAGIVHREVRANAFHLSAHTGIVRFVHFGNRAVSLENSGSPSNLVLKAFDDEKIKVKEALCYLAPEQTGSIETIAQDHRTDLYSLGILFWTLLVGRGQLPFEGGPLELLHSIVQKTPILVQDVRRDVPEVLGSIIDKLLSKHPDTRYQSAYGLKADLLECQRRLLASVSSEVSSEFRSTDLIPTFDIATQDRYIEFTLPLALFGREKETDVIKNVIRNTQTSFSRHFSASKGQFTITSSSGSGTAGGDDRTDSMSSTSAHSSSNVNTNPTAEVVRTSSMKTSTYEQSIVSGSAGSSFGDGLRRTTLRSKPTTRTQAVIVTGPPGVGKSSVVLANQAKWRGYGLWGHAKFQNVDAAPFSAVLSCLSSVLRQLMVFHTDVHRFVNALKDKLGPQIQNAPLLYQGAPELQDILGLLDIHLDTPRERLTTRELRARFQTLVENVFTVIADTRMLALFLDDLQDADESTLDLVSALINSKSRMLIFATIRSDRSDVLERVRSMFTSRSKPVWINLEPLSYFALAALVAKTLRLEKEDCAPLARLIYDISSGNAFAARNLLNTFHRQGFITFNGSSNNWSYDMNGITTTLDGEKVSDPTDLTFLVSQLRALPSDARKYLTWAGFFGESFKVTEVALMMHLEDSSGSSGSEDERDERWSLHKVDAKTNAPRGSIVGLQKALDEGWLIQRARDMCSFSHDRYRQAAQAEATSLPEETISKMSFRIVLMMLHESPVDAYRIAEHAKRCLTLLHDHPKREELLSVLMDAGEEAWNRGAHELAIRSFTSARTLLRNNPWADHSHRTYVLFSRLASLANWQGKFDLSNTIVEDCLSHTERPEDKATLLRLRSRNHWMRGEFSAALDDTLLALKILGVEVDPAPSKRRAERMFTEVENEILAVGHDEIFSLTRTTDPRHLLAVQLLNDAGTNAYWSPSPNFAEIIGLTTIKQALRHGLAPGTGLGFFWALGAENRKKYRFSSDLSKLALRIADRYGTSSEKCRARVLYCAMVSGYNNTHIRSQIPQLEEAVKFGRSAGDRVYTAFASTHALLTRFFVCEHLSELVPTAEEVVSDIEKSASGKDTVVLAMGVLNCVRALGGYTDGSFVENIFDTEDFKEKQYAEKVQSETGNIDLVMNWYNSLKLVAYYCLGYSEEAAKLGFYVYNTRHKHPNHRHVRYALFFHSLAMIACLRKKNVVEDVRTMYLAQIGVNQAFIEEWLSPGPVNSNVWVALVEAELKSLLNDPDAIKSYDKAIRLAIEHDWLMEEGWGHYLEGCHFIRMGVTGLGGELQRRGISRHSQWGAQGIVNYLNTVIGHRPQYPSKRPTFTADVAVQTSPPIEDNRLLYRRKTDTTDTNDSTLRASDLDSILKWSTDISSNINLFSALQRLTEIATEISGSQSTCVVIVEEGDYTVATTMHPPEDCQVYEHHKSVRSLEDPLQQAVIRHSLNTKDRVVFDEGNIDPRFLTESQQTQARNVICLPIFSNRGQTFGVVYVSTKYSFPENTLTMLTLLCQQASISVSNALLFRSVQAGTKENLKMISAQRDALETARKSREDALKATKIKSNFLASMSHELRTPFSSFYGLLDLLTSTQLDSGQSEIVQTAKQSCELLLKIIDSILDYSKLEASALKLEPNGFAVENIIADCMELLLPMAAKKLDLSYNIEASVPPWVFADDARIRQVLMNLIGNAVKFTEKGSVQVTCCVVNTGSMASPDEVNLKFVIQDTGIGLAPSDVELLFTPFQQADNSSTRKFGGTGLGLSISRQLVKLMNGAIGVESELHVGSKFWFNIPVKIFQSDESKRGAAELEHLKANLQHTNIVVCSGSTVTLALLQTFLTGFNVTLLSTLQDVEMHLRGFTNLQPPLDFIVLDDQSDDNANDLARFLKSLHVNTLQDTKVIHLYTPITHVSRPIFGTAMPGVVKMTKPPRQTRLLQLLANLKNVPSAMITLQSPSVPPSPEKPVNPPPQRTLYGNVLIAEDNPIAQQLLVKILQRADLTVFATSNGNEAISEWESRDPGFFTVALFDHHMPICDGVEAAKRIRVLESKRKCPYMLPIVALSADCQESTKQLCLSAGMNAFFSKPLKHVDLTALLSMFTPRIPSNT